MKNPKISETNKVLIPPVSLQDKIKTLAFGMAMIKLLCLSGFLLEDITKIGQKKWYLAPICKSRKMFLFVNSLSLDRFRHLLKN